MQCLRAALCLAVVLAGTLIPATVRAVDGFMIRVTSDRAEIKRDDKVLATVAKGTRLWVFDVKDRKWARVKAPDREERGWLYYSDIEKIVFSDAEKARLEDAYTHHDNALEFYKQNQLADSIRELQASLTIEREIKGSDSPEVADTLLTLGYRVGKQRDYALARKHLDESLAIYLKALGRESTSTAKAFTYVADFAYDQHEYATARKDYEEAVSIYRKTLGNEHQETANVLINLGSVADDQGDFAVARKCYDEALATFRKVVGDDDPRIAGLLTNLGNLACDQGDYAFARRYYEEVLAIRRKVLGNAHPDTADVLNNLGFQARHQGDYTAALRYYDEALAIRRKVLAGDASETADTLNNLGAVLLDQGDYRSASKYLVEALAIRRKVLGNQHKYTAETLSNLGNVARGQGNYSSARKYYEEALGIERKVLGSKHPLTAGTLMTISTLSGDEGDLATARKGLEEALAIDRKVLGIEHPDTILILDNLAWILYQTHDTEGSSKCLDESRHAVCTHEMRTLPALSQQELFQYLEHMHDQAWYYSLSFGVSERANSKIAALSASWLVNGKAIGDESMAEAVLLSKPETSQLVSRLQFVHRKLADLTIKSESSERDQLIAGLENQQRSLIGELGQARGENLSSDPWVSSDAVRRAIRAKSLMINIARFDPYDFKTKKQGPARYVAWLFPPAGDGEIKIIELGDAEPIDAAVAAFQGDK